MPNAYIQEVLERLNDNPTAGELDYFLVAHVRIGQLVAQARGLAEQAEAQAKVDRASAYAAARRDGAKSATDAEARAVVESADSESAAISAREKYQKISAIYRSVEEVINGIKFLGRNDGTMTLPRR